MTCWLIRIGVLAASTLLVASPGHAQNFSPFSAFQNLSATDLSSLQVKLTFVGDTEKPIKSVLFTAVGSTADISAFAPFHRPDIVYSNDSATPRMFNSAVAELHSMLTQFLPAVPAVVAGGESSTPQISFSMVQKGSSTIGFEAVLNIADGQALITALRGAFAANQPAMKAINLFACATSVEGTTTPSNVTASTTVSIGGVRLNRTTGHFVATLTLKNNSASALAGPINVVIQFQGSVRLFNTFGYTCLVSPEGVDTLSIPVPNNMLAAGASVQVQLDILNPNNEPVQPTTTVYAGAGSL
jgi:hypothetical protein